MNLMTSKRIQNHPKIMPFNEREECKLHDPRELQEDDDEAAAAAEESELYPKARPKTESKVV